MSFHSDMSSKKSLGFRRDDRIVDFFGKKIKSEGHSASSISPVRKVKSPKLRSKSRERPSSSSSPIQAKKVTFYRNGDPFFKGVVLAISTKIYPSIDSLILDANRHPICDVSVLPKGIRYVFSTKGKLITSLDELQEGKGYVFSSTETFKPLPYGGVNPLLLRSRLPADMLSYSSFQREERHQRELTVQEICDFVPSRTIYVIRAGPRPRYTTKMTLYNGTNSSLGQVIDSMEQKLFMSKGGIKHLCSVSGNEVKCLEDLFVEDTIFIAFTTEVISPDDLLLSASEITTSPPSGSKLPSSIVWTNPLPRFPSDIKKPKIVTVVNRGHAGDERGIPFALLSKYRVSKTVIWTDCTVMKRCYTKTDSRQVLAMKIFDKSRLTSDELDAIYYELSILRRLKQNNILQYFDEMDTIPELYMLVEYFMGKNLFDAILLSEIFTERDAGHLMSELCSAISYLHSLSIIHRNIKPDNILVSCDRPVGVWHLRLAGLASAVQITEDSVSELCGTLEYAAPEMLQGIRYGSKVDIWSAGVVCYQILCGLLPFRYEESGDQQKLIQRILAAHVDFPSPFWDLISDSAKDLVLHMLTRNPKLRCKASDVFNHSWLQKTASHLFILRGKNVNLRNAIVTNLEISNNSWASKTAKSCHMSLASSFCSPRKAYEERTSSPDQEARRSLSSQSAPSCSDSDQSLFKLTASPKGYRYISCPSDVGANQNDVVYGDTNQSQSSLDRDSLPPTDRTIRHSRVVPNNIESSGFDCGSSQLCTDQSNSQPCVGVGVDSVKTDTGSGKFDSSHFGHDISASALRGTTSSISDIFSIHSVSTDNTSSSDRRSSSAVKQPCSASTQTTTSSELIMLPAVQTIDAADILSNSSSATAPTVVELRNESEATYPGMTSPRSRIPFPLSLFFSSTPSAPPVIQTSAAQSTAGSVDTDYQLMTAQMCSASLNGGHDSSSDRLTNAKSSTSGSASSSVHPAHIENRILLPDQSSTPSDGQTSSRPVLAFAPPSKPLPPASNHSDLPMLQFAPSTKSAVPPKLSQLQHVPSSPRAAKTSLVSNLPVPQHSAHTYQQNQLLHAKSFPQYASDPVHDSQHIQTLTRSSIQSSQAPTIEQPSNISEKMLQHGFPPRPKEPNFHPVHHRHQHSVNHASTSTEVDQPQLTATHASPSQMMTAALKVFDPEDQQGHVKDARLSSGNQKPNMNMARVAVETVCWMSSNPQKSADKEQTGKSDVPSMTSPSCNKGDSPACNKGDSPASSSSSHDEFLSPSSSLHNGGLSDNSSQTCLSGFSEGDNDDVSGSTSSWSTHCSIKNAR